MSGQEEGGSGGRAGAGGLALNNVAQVLTMSMKQSERQNPLYVCQQCCLGLTQEAY